MKILRISLLISVFIICFNPLKIHSKRIDLSYERDFSFARILVEESVNSRKGYEMLRELSAIGPRLSGSANSLKAIDWAKNKMEELGFDKVWLQPVMVPHWERGETEKVTVVNGDSAGRELRISTLGGSIGTADSGITAGVIEVRTFEELRIRKDEVKGKIVFLNIDLTAMQIDPFKGYYALNKYRNYGAIESALAGAEAVLLRSLTTKYDNVPHTGAQFYRDNVKQIPGAALGLIDADYLSAELKQNPGLELNITLSAQIHPDALSYNVIGEITGSQNPEKVIVVGGHLDTWDVGDGSHDDGAGCIQTLEILDLYKRLHIRPKNTIRVVFFMNEENGMKGGIEYGNYAGFNKDEVHLAAIEADRGAFTPRGFSVDADAKTTSVIKSWLPYFNAAGIDFVRKGGSGADVAYINGTKAKIGFIPEDEKFFDYHHSDNDVFESIDPVELQQGAAAMAILVYMIDEYGLEI